MVSTCSAVEHPNEPRILLLMLTTAFILINMWKYKTNNYVFQVYS